MDKTISNRIFIALIAVYALMAALGVFLPQDASGTTISSQQLPAPLWVIVLANVGLAVVIYGGFGFLGLTLARKLNLPEIWDAAVSNRNRFLVPALTGVAVGAVIILGDLLFSPFNGIGHFPHPPFPTSIVASIGAGIGEEVMFRLFFISFWTWLVSKVILRGRWQAQVFAVVSFLAAIAFGMGHLPGLMFQFGWTDMSQVPPMLLAEILLLNGILAGFAACYFKKYGFLAAVGTHLWADLVWHVVWGLL